MNNEGYIEAGTEAHPYTSKLIITMHSKRADPELPIYGNKVIATYNGVTDFHGIPRHPTWSQMETTANIGDNKITIFEPVDWKAGEEIVVAPTGYYNREAEQFTILAVDNTNPNKPVITLNSTLKYKHFAGIQWFDE